MMTFRGKKINTLNKQELRAYLEFMGHVERLPKAPEKDIFSEWLDEI